MILKLEDIFDYSFLSFALILSLFIDNINGMLSFLTFDFVSDLLSLTIQILVLVGLVLKLKKFKKTDETGK
tara:strand:+ start:17063 stop:17275 length:213 start_codon:yes stop_codon:yes gene_type:complete